MNNELDFAGAYAILLGLLVSLAWIVMVSIAGLMKLDEKLQAIKRRLQRQVPEYRHPRFGSFR